jgi:hypothetical protein
MFSKLIPPNAPGASTGAGTKRGSEAIAPAKKPDKKPLEVSHTPKKFSMLPRLLCCNIVTGATVNKKLGGALILYDDFAFYAIVLRSGSYVFPQELAKMSEQPIDAALSAFDTLAWSCTPPGRGKLKAVPKVGRAHRSSIQPFTNITQVGDKPIGNNFYFACKLPRIRSDRGSVLISKVIRILAARYGIQIQYTPARLSTISRMG